MGNRAESVLEWVCLDLAGMVSPERPSREQSLVLLTLNSRFPLPSVQTVICKPDCQGVQQALAACHLSRLLGEATLQGICSGKSSVCESILPLVSASALHSRTRFASMQCLFGGNCLTCHHVHRNPSGLGRFLVRKKQNHASVGKVQQRGMVTGEKVY